MKAVTLAAIEASVLSGSYHVALTILSAFSTSKGLCGLVGAGCNAEGRGAGRERSHVIFVRITRTLRSPCPGEKLTLLVLCDKGSVHKGSPCSRVRWETTADTADEIIFRCFLIIRGTSLSLPIYYQSFYMHCSFEGKQQVTSMASWECPPQDDTNTLKRQSPYLVCYNGKDPCHWIWRRVQMGC